MVTEILAGIAAAASVANFAVARSEAARAHDNVKGLHGNVNALASDVRILDHRTKDLASRVAAALAALPKRRTRKAPTP